METRMESSEGPATREADETPGTPRRRRRIRSAVGAGHAGVLLGRSIVERKLIGACRGSRAGRGWREPGATR